MARDERIVLRRNDSSGAGVVFKTRKDANAFLDANDNQNQKLYVEESADQTEANQRAADEAVANGEAEDKAVAGPRRSRG